MDSHVVNSKKWNYEFIVAEHVGVVTMCSTAKFTVPIFAVFEV